MNTNIRLFFCFVLCLNVVSCGGGTDSADIKTSYNGPGSHWQITLNETANTFHIEKSNDVGTPVVLTAEGDYERTAEGFLDMTIRSGTGIDAPGAGDKAYGLEIPGVAFLLKARDGDPRDPLITMITSGACPATDVNLNWVLTKKSSLESAEDAHGFFGSAIWNNATGIFSGDEYNLGLVYNGSMTTSAASCENGVASLASGTVLYFSESGAVIAKGIDPAGERITFALPAATMTDIGSFDGAFSGFLQDEGSGGDFTRRLTFNCAAGVCTANLIDGTGAGDISFTSGINSPIDGFVTGDINTLSGHNGTIACMANISLGSKKVLSCVGQSPGDNPKMMSAILVSQ